MLNNNILISKEELHALLKQNKPVTILDIRLQKDREEFIIPGSVHADVYDKLKVQDDQAFDALNIPHHQLIVTVCNGGSLSITAAEILQRKGYKALSLEGGMKNWNANQNE
jgi:rhodanese-related sulfurtransferase